MQHKYNMIRLSEKREVEKIGNKLEMKKRKQPLFYQGNNLFFQRN
jgi:hypothetical protein